MVTKGHSALFPVPGHDRNARAATYGDRWLIEPSETMYYAIAVDNGRDARRLATLIDELPQHCGTNSTAGLKGYALQEWLEDLSHLMLKLGRHAEWRAVEVNPVY